MNKITYLNRTVLFVFAAAFVSHVAWLRRKPAYYDMI